jgi:hypothetical protein
MREAEFAALLRAGQDEFAARRRVLRAAGVIMAGCALCAALVLLSWSAGGEGGSELLSSSSLPKLAPLQELHWVNHEFRKVHTMQAHPTRLELADQNAERQARTAAKWGTLAATKDVFRSKQFTAQLESMKENAQLTESKAQKLDSEINYEGKLLKVGRQGTSSIIAQAAMAAHDAIGSVSGAVSAANPAHDGPSDGRTFRSHEFVEVYPKPYHYAHGMPGGTRFQKEEKKFLAGVDHEVRMHKLAADLKLTQKKGTDSDADDKSDGILESRTDMTDGVDPSSTAAAAKRLAMSRASDAVHGTNLVDDKSDGILESRTDMTDGVDPSATAAAAKRLAVSRAGSVKQAQGTNLATPADSSDDKGLLDNHRDMGNGVDTKATQEAARKLATSLVRKMQESAEATVLKGGAAGQKAAANDSEMKRAEDDDAKKVQKLQDWAKANPSDNAKVRELKKELWQAEEQQEEAHSKGGDASQTGARVAASAARKIETSNGKTRSEMIGKVRNGVHSVAGRRG